MVEALNLIMWLILKSGYMKYEQKIKIITSNLFKKNLKRYKKKHYDISQLENVIDVLIKNDVQKLKIWRSLTQRKLSRLS